MAQDECFYDSLEEDTPLETKIEIVKYYKEKSKSFRSKIPVYSPKPCYRCSARSGKRSACTSITNLKSRDKSVLKYIEKNVQNSKKTQSLKNYKGTKDEKYKTEKPHSGRNDKRPTRSHVRLILATKNNLLEKQKQRKTYLGMFKAKSGGNTEKTQVILENESTKSTCGYSTARTIGKYSENLDSDYENSEIRNGPEQDTVSTYKNFMFDTTDRISMLEDHLRDECLYIEDCKKYDDYRVSNINLEQLCSVSEACVSTTKQIKPCIKYNLKDYRHMKPPDMVCGLGPDILSPSRKEKLDKLKKMQEYGARASIRNRARVIAQTKRKPKNGDPVPVV